MSCIWCKTCLLLLQMHYLVYFYCDEQIVYVDDEDVVLGEYESYSLDDWQRLPVAVEPKVRVVYDNIIYDACVLQVAPKDTVPRELLEKLRTFVSRKRFKAARLLQIVNRVCMGRRNYVPPVEVSSQFIYL